MKLFPKNGRLLGAQQTSTPQPVLTTQVFVGEEIGTIVNTLDDLHTQTTITGGFLISNF